MPSNENTYVNNTQLYIILHSSGSLWNKLYLNHGIANFPLPSKFKMWLYKCFKKKNLPIYSLLKKKDNQKCSHTLKVVVKFG